MKIVLQFTPTEEFDEPASLDPESIEPGMRVDSPDGDIRLSIERNETVEIISEIFVRYSKQIDPTQESLEQFFEEGKENLEHFVDFPVNHYRYQFIIDSDTPSKDYCNLTDGGNVPPTQEHNIRKMTDGKLQVNVRPNKSPIFVT